MDNNIAALYAIIKPQRDRFNELNLENLLSWDREFSFAMQALSKSYKLLLAAINDPLGVKAAILNVASTGISLNPVLEHAYLIPRGGKIYLFISYRGLMKIAIDSGAINWAKSELVYNKDIFEWRGVCEMPLHKADYFGDRGNVVGGYCVAALNCGGYNLMIETMTIGDIKKAQAKSKATSGDVPWVTWWEQMAKKTILRRASKTWPPSQGGRLEKAIHVLNESEGFNLDVKEENVIEGSTVLAIEGIMREKNREKNLEGPPEEEKTEKPNLQPTHCDELLDEIEAAGNHKALALVKCSYKMKDYESLSQDEKNKLRMAHESKQRELGDEKNV